MTKCSNCNGTGKIANGMWLCHECQGTGYIEDEKPQKKRTNGDWFLSLPLEEQIDVLTKKVMDIISWNNDPKPSEVHKSIENWLRGEHNE